MRKFKKCEVFSQLNKLFYDNIKEEENERIGAILESMNKYNTKYGCISDFYFD